MSLRTRLLLAYGYLVALILAVAGISAIALLHLSSGINVVMEDNFRSIRASMEMIESLERQNSETLAALLEGEADRGTLARLEASFYDALRIAQGNVTEPEEIPVLERMEKDFAAFVSARDALIAERSATPLASYNQQVSPRFARVKEDVLQLLEINQRAMIQAERRASETATQAATALGFLVALGLVSFVVLARVMQRHVLGRLEELGRSIEAIATRDRGRRLREEGDDELTHVARRMNELLDRHQREESRLQGLVRQERQLALGLVDRLGPRVAAYDLAGNRVAGGDDGESAIRRWIRGEGRTWLENWNPGDGALDGPVTGKSGSVEGTAELLVANGVRPVGWLVHRSSDG